MRFLQRWTVHQHLYTVVGALVLIMTSLRITPSSYGVALQLFGAEGAGLIAGQPRPVRSDEWAVMTPAIQATVNNHFERYNTTSFYKEDLRQIYPLPVHDWGLLFRPTYWLFGVLPAKFAFAAHWALMPALLIVGLALLFRRLGLVGLNAWMLAACIFWSGFVQYFWTIAAPVLAWWPWVTLAILNVRRTWLALPLVTYAFTCWALGLFYPPLFVSLGFVTACIMFASRRNRLSPRQLAACAIACALGAAIALFYLREPLIALNQTIYPGSRRNGGGGMYFERFVSIFLPNAFIYRTEPFGVRAPIAASTNICEFGVIGSVYFLFACLVISPQKLISSRFRSRRTEAVVLGLGLAAIFAWMALPLPAWLGTPLLWDRVPPPRMVVPAGVLLAVVSAFVFRRASVRLTPARLIVGLVIILGFVCFKMSHGVHSFRLVNRDLLPAVGVIAVYAFRRRLSAAAEHSSLLAIAALTNFFCFATFNPLQQADPIFELPATPQLGEIASRAERQHGRPLLLAYPGSVLNGLGFASINHVLAVPQMDRWRSVLPGVPESELQTTFNRYAHINVSDRDDVFSPQADVAQVPLRLLLPGAQTDATCTTTTAVSGGTVRTTSVAPDNVVMQGQVPAAGIFRDQHFSVVEPHARDVHVDVSPDPALAGDGGHDLYSFTLVIRTGDGFDPGRACVVFVDEATGERVALDNPEITGECDPCTAR